MENLIEKYKDKLPESYLDFLSNDKSFEGYLGDEFGYVALWDERELHEAWEGYEFVERLGNDWFPIGSNRGGEVIAIKITPPLKKLFYIPFIPMSTEYADLYCDDFSSLYDAIKQHLGKSSIQNRKS